MKNNIGSTDKIIRLALAIIVGLLYYNDLINGTLALILGTMACVLFITSFISFCPLYTLIGVNTCENKSAK
ncbi:YgaP family membrane protein [Flavobacterium tegetincola]|uniref:YgaP family membrane protein n=1 Tax=Flavobacterium tegetincola TaxID=150172 RepID=UPI000A078BFC|nr:DUF2892 domain-containing protein [Flavobacterium tegetincola]